MELLGRLWHRRGKAREQMVGQDVRGTLVLLACHRIAPREEHAMDGELLGRERHILTTRDHQVRILALAESGLKSEVAHAVKRFADELAKKGMTD